MKTRSPLRMIERTNSINKLGHLSQTIFQFRGHCTAGEDVAHLVTPKSTLEIKMPTSIGPNE